MNRKLHRLAYLLKTLANRADQIALAEMGVNSHLMVGEMYNDYIRQLSEMLPGEMINEPKELTIPAGVEETEAAGFLSNLALQAVQVARELEYMLENELELDEDGFEDWADALARMSTAGIDVDQVLEEASDLIVTGGKIDRKWVDGLIRLSTAGVDVDSAIEYFISGYHRRRKHHQHRFPNHLARETNREILRKRPSNQDRTNQAELADEWRMEILARIEKGELSPADAIPLLEQNHPPDGSREDEDQTGGESSLM